MRSWNRPLLAFGGAMVLLTLVCLGGLLLDPRTLGGTAIWAKPFKFSLSFLLYAPTLAWMISLVSAPRAHRWASGAGTVVAVTSTIEMVAIVGQVVRGVGSHFNVATPFDTAVWAVMGTSVAVLWVANLAIAVLLLRERALSPTTAWAVRLGLAVSLLGMAVAFLMVGPTGSQITAAQTTGTMATSGAHAVGAADGGPGLPLLGWSTTGGDLRVAHFVGLHGLQVVPLVALGLWLLATRLTGPSRLLSPRHLPVHHLAALPDARTRTRLVVLAAGAWTGLTVLLTVQALRAQPLLAPDAWTLAGAAVLVVVTVLAAAAVLRAAPRPAVGERVAVAA